MPSLKSKILIYLGGKRWVNGGEIERFAMDQGMKASNGSRRARELAEDKKIFRKEMNGSVWYMAKYMAQTSIYSPAKQKEMSEKQRKLF